MSAAALIMARAPRPGEAKTRLAALGAGRDVCLVPALDGGYAMIALARASVEPFRMALWPRRAAA